MIDSREFPISPYDTCASVYAKVADSTSQMLLDLVPKLAAGEHPGSRQPTGTEPVLPRRRPADGAIDWEAGGRSIYDLIRAVTDPYPGAIGWLGGEKILLWSASFVPIEGGVGVPPGTVVGPVISPIAESCGQAVSVVDGLLTVLEIEERDRRVSGRSCPSSIGREGPGLVSPPRKIVVIAAHPDDELLGCGGTVARHADRGDQITSVIVCEGESHRYEDGEVDQMTAAKKAADILGVGDVRFLGFPDQRLDEFTLTDIITPIEQSRAHDQARRRLVSVRRRRQP